MQTINEGSDGFVTIVFKDHNGALVTPISARYRLDKTDTVVKEWTTFYPAASYYVINITGAENSISSGASAEIMRITIEWKYDSDKIGTTDFTYSIVNLVKYP